MIKNYLKIIIRNMKKYRTFSIITISGLAMGLACFFLILLFIQDELSYDSYHQKGDRIYRLVDSFDVPGGIGRDFALTSAPMAPTLKKDYPEVEDSVRFFPRRRMVTYKEKKYYEDNLIYTDSSVFNIFTFTLIKGNPKTVLAAPNTVVISQKIASKYFGQEEPLNKTLRIKDQDFLVTGIMREIPKNSHFFINIFASLKTLEQNPKLQKTFFQDWIRHEFYSYLLLKEGSSAEELQAKLPAFIEKYAAQQVKSVLGGRLSSSLQSLKSIHLFSHLQMEISPNSDIKFIYIFSVVVFFILLIACVNFTNLATAQSANRVKEVGLRKVVGASRNQLVKQFLGESIIFTLLALVLAMILIALTLPFFNSLTGKEIEANYFGNFTFLGFVILILFLVGITSGSYPSFVISRYQPINILKSSLNVGPQRALLKKGLVILQFTISIVLIIATAVVIHQLDFMRNRKLGFDKENVVVVPIRVNSLRTNVEEIKADLMQNRNILSATIAVGVPGGLVAGDAIKLVNEKGTQTMAVRMIYSDHDYIKTMGMQIVEGRDFSKKMSTDAKQAFIINEAAVRELQLKDPLKTRFEWRGLEYGVEKKGMVIGVVKDFQFLSLKSEINPLIIHIHPAITNVFAMRIRPGNIPETIKFIKKKWKVLDPAHPFEYSFMNETFDKIYRNEEKLSYIFSVFSILAIFIASLGLFGLSLFIVEKKTKEIGIRKVLGASTVNICIFISKEFIRLVLFSNLFAWPIAYFFMDKWLQNFSCRVNIQPWIFVLAGVLAFVIALLTISFHVIKAAISNPVKSLRYE